MAGCEQGYRCEICGLDVDEIVHSDLYLRFVLGEVHPERLPSQPERHIRCNPILAQFITAEDFEPVIVTGPFSKSELDREFVAEEEARVTTGYLHLREIGRCRQPASTLDDPQPGSSQARAEGRKY